MPSRHRRPLIDHSPDTERPLAHYAAMTTVFLTAFTGATATAARRRGLPERIAPGDLVLTGIATHKVSRLIAKDKVTGFVRAPFTRFEDFAGHGEVEETPRGSSGRRAVGELLLCPYCLSQWVAGAFTVGWIAAPRTTRLLASMWTAQTIADCAQLAYHAAEQRD